MRLSLRTAVLAAIALASAACAQSACADPTPRAEDSEAAILAEINFARTHPQEYARKLLLQPVSTWEAAVRAGGDDEDPGAYAEAIDFLMRQSPLPPLSDDADLTSAAAEHTAAQGPDGEIGHCGHNGERFDARLRRHGVAGALVAENIAYGPQSAADVVRELIIDRGVASRGHRTNIFHAGLEEAGVKCGAHKTYGTMCVIDFASRPEEPTGWRQAALSPQDSGSPLFHLLRRR
jgi:uncharacterized protein YkwD